VTWPQAAIASFSQHPDAGIITSFPGLGPLTGARVLAETGDDRSRFTDAKGLKACAGAAPITRASGKTLPVLHRRVKNQRLAAAGYIWAFPPSPPHPAPEPTTTAAKPPETATPPPSATCSAVSSGCLHYCLATGQHYDEHTAFPAPAEVTQNEAA